MSRKKILRALVFPYDDEMYPYLRCSSMLDGIKIQMLMAPESWGARNVNVCGLEICTELTDDWMDKIDILWLCDSIGEVSDECVRDLVQKMLSHSKQIMIARQLNSGLYHKIWGMCENIPDAILPIGESVDTQINDSSGFLDHIAAPLISISGPGENTDKFLTQLLLKEYLEKNGCKVAMVASRTDCAALKGVYSFPLFMGYDNIANERKIIMYNRMLKKIEKEINPDFFIVGIPGSVLPSAKIYARNFELGPYTVFKAISPFYSIMCLYGNHVSYDYLDELRQTMKYKYGTDVDFYYRSSSAVDFDSLMDAKIIESINTNIDDSAYIYDDIDKIGDIILHKNKK